jgi:hypothetical protein
MPGMGICMACGFCCIRCGGISIIFIIPGGGMVAIPGCSIAPGDMCGGMPGDMCGGILPIGDIPAAHACQRHQIFVQLRQAGVQMLSTIRTAALTWNAMR